MKTKNIFYMTLSGLIITVLLLCSCNRVNKTGSLTWRVKEGTLTISGQGAMPNYSNGGTPWNSKWNYDSKEHYDITSIIINEGVTNIGDYAFADCNDVVFVSMPNSVTIIGESAFENCESIISITLPANLTHIDKSAFAKCEKLTLIDIPDNVVNIGDLSFERCFGLKSVSLGKKVAFIGCDAFEGCTNIQSVTSTNPVPPILETRVETKEITVFNLDDSSKSETETRSNDHSAFNSVAENCRLIVPDEYIATYKKDKEWNKFYTYYNKNKRTTRVVYM